MEPEKTVKISAETHQKILKFKQEWHVPIKHIISEAVFQYIIHTAWTPPRGIKK